MRVNQVILHANGTVTLFYEGADPQTDYFPMASRVTQRYALEQLAKVGVTPGCVVAEFNYREAGQPLPDAARKARSFAAKAHLPFRDNVRFPDAASPAEAAKLARKLEPAIKTRIVSHNFYKNGDGPMGLWFHAESL